MSTVTQATAQQATVQRPSINEEFRRTDLAQWKAVVARANDPVTARLIVETLDADPASKGANLGVYLAARETVQRDRIRFARQYRFGRNAAAVVRFVWWATTTVVGFIAGAVSRARSKPVVTQPVAPQGVAVAAHSAPVVGDVVPNRAQGVAQPAAAMAPAAQVKVGDSVLVYPTIMFPVPEFETKASAIH